MGDWKSSEEAKQLTEASPRNIVGARGISMEQLQVWEFRDPHKAVTAELKLFESLRETGTYRNAILKNKPVVKANVVNHRGFQFHEVTLEWDLEKTYKAWYGDRLAKVLGGSHLEVLAETLREGMLAYLEESLGKRVPMWFGTDGKAFVRVGAKDWTAARTSLDCYLDKSVALGLDEAYQRAREELPAEAGLLVLVDVTKTWLFQLMDMPLRKVVKRKASYLGIAAAPTPQGMTLGLWIPNTVVGRMLFLDLAP